VSYALTFDGIPYVFAESRLRTVAGAEVSVPANYTLSAALCITEGQSIAHDCDRETGFAAGLELDVLLGRQQLADEGLTSTLFARPTKSTYLTSSVTSSSTTTFSVDSTSAFSATGTVYIGHELISYTSKTSTTFAGITRGLCGLKHYHPSDVSSGYRQVTDKPVYWVGRFVTLYEHLVSPEGRYFGSTLATVGTYCRELWRGYVVEVPRPEMGGMVIRCAPLVRKLAQQIGAEISGQFAYGTGQFLPLIYVTRGDQIRAKLVSGSGSHDVWSQPNADALGAGLVEKFTSSVQQSLQTQIGTGHLVQVNPTSFGVPGLAIRLRSTGSHGWIVDSTAWFLTSQEPSEEGNLFSLPYVWAPGQPPFNDCWVVVRLDQSAAYQNAVIASGGGLLRMEVNGVTELCYFSEIDTSTGDDGSLTAFHITRRALNGVRVNPWLAEACTVTVASGAQGTWKEIFLSLATSSGLTGERSAYDTLAYGFGLGIPGGDFDFEVPSGTTTLAVEPDSSIIDEMSGELALGRQCLIPIQVDGDVKMASVSTDVQTSALEPLTSDDVLLSGHGTPQLLESPNQILLTSQSDSTGIVVRDASRAQNEGVREIEYRVFWPPNRRISAEIMMQKADGLATVDLEVPPWVAYQPGDALDLQTAHPRVYDWSSGAWAPASVPARVLGWARDLWSGTTRLTLLLSGQATPSVLLCPAYEVITAVSSTEFRIAKNLRVGTFRVNIALRPGITVAIYKPGDEATQYEERVISTFTSGATYDTVTITSALSAVTAAAGIVITYPIAASSDSGQKAFIYESAGYFWR
jgi:hypothetical protein